MDPKATGSMAEQLFSENGRPLAVQVPLKNLPREWGVETFFADTERYLGKILRMKAGTKGGLQYHAHKVETFYVLEGTVIVRSESEDGQLVSEHVSGGMPVAYHIPAGAVHQVEAVTDCVLIEASTAHYNDRVHVEAEFGLPEAGGLPTTR